jgi:chromosome partitioning protein
MIIVLANEKGGVGKTTVAVGLAAFWARRRRVVLVDADPQGSARAWLDGTQELEVLTHPQRMGLGAFLEQQAARPDVDLVLVDTPPTLGGALREAVRVADVVLVPVRPSAVDLGPFSATVSLVQILGRPATAVHVIITQAVVGTLLARDAREVFGQAGVPVCKTVLYHRVAHVEAAMAQKPLHRYAPDSLAAAELEALARELSKEVFTHDRIETPVP